MTSWDWRGKQELVLRGLACHAKGLELVRGITHQIYTWENNSRNVEQVPFGPYLKN